MADHQIVSRTEWLEARKALLAQEKAHTRVRDDLSRARRELPWVKVETPYVFTGPAGPQTLGDLFDDRSQLIVYHFMLGPGQPEGCIGCSFLADHIAGPLQHVVHHDVSIVVVSRAPLPEIEAYKRRMGWTFPWVSSYGSPFNHDYQVSFTKEDMAKGPTYYNYAVRQSQNEEEASGHSVFYKDAAGDIFHTYSSYGRGGEEVLGTYAWIDMTPKGRNENGPQFNLMDWVHRHDQYVPAAPDAHACCGSAPKSGG
jgi:predicted dithiol-disulfide oxidoreductase (DUF899 family)